MQFSPEAKKLVNPQLTDPKVRVVTTTADHSIEPKSMIVGSSVERQEVTAVKNSENRIVNGEININKPIIAQVNQPVTKIERTESVIDVNSGNVTKLSNSGNSDIAFHGI